jgi:hypothetical protein
MEWYWWVLVIALVVLTFKSYLQMCKDGSNEDDLREKLFAEYLEKKQNQIDVSCDKDVLSHLEKSAVNELLKNINEDRDTYIPANEN